MDTPAAEPEKTNGHALTTTESKPTPPPIPEVERQMRESLQGKLRDIVSRPLSPRMLVELEKTARLARELLVVGKDPRALRDRYTKWASEDNYTTWEAQEAAFAGAPGYDAPLPPDVPDNSLVEPGFELIPMGSAKKVAQERELRCRRSS